MTDSPLQATVRPIRDASRRLVRELGFMKPTLAGTEFSASAVHALIEIGARDYLTSGELSDILNLEKSSVSRMVRKLVDAGELVESVSETDSRIKPLSLTGKGRETLAAIDAFAQEQVVAALNNLSPNIHKTVRDGLALYADALEASRTGSMSSAMRPVTIETGYRPGVIGRAAEMHARFYANTVGFGQFFESKVASGLAEFAGRLDRSSNQLWTAIEDGNIVGTVVIDGEDLGTGCAHLRWFIVEDGRRGGGLGRRLLDEAISFCDQQEFAEIQLWTFKGLDAARRLYETFGFVLDEEWPGQQWGSEVTEQRFVRRIRDVGRRMQTAGLK
ncbi:helix-turn-helix domain-containing GNAT family N-acetyltransferase [Phyllobacterium myrsinacearum]|uniref:DNA-binding MarR family transcriptional regulator/GNAT superfamily N-acetyltransferase n=1 Tax=Phyllobacterium myrsinacearum TaxID=28101 RepID=A0A839EQD9_9HYPH|nr:helix-turn-helix domain-containing GNAT family N-acetyltransferase [Phyllobacterium myrsinacearum]MBA8879724.1 DNA-binding MarR family transcriptional regulator/GNAT superfamily N-acetyltransferase [Phyllobacterium myrsinacearum]